MLSTATTLSKAQPADESTVQVLSGSIANESATVLLAGTLQGYIVEILVMPLA